MDTYADIILPVPLEGTFTYVVPPHLVQAAKEGTRVVVSFGRSKKYVGLIDRLHHAKPEGYEVKPIEMVMDSQPIVTAAQLKLWHWMADYYLSPVGEVYKAALPAGLKAEEGFRPRTETYIRLAPAFATPEGQRIALSILARATKQREVVQGFISRCGGRGEGDKDIAQGEMTREELMNVTHATLSTVQQLMRRGIMETYEVEVGRLNHGGEPHPELIKPLSAAQQDAYNRVRFGWLKHNVMLLHGVTGSGKTEIYIHLIQKALDDHQQVLYLLPEIALTVQMMDRLRRVFGSRLGIYHSKYSDAERVEIWQKQLSGHPYDIILGARSAVFLPFQRLGLVIVDEEHETSYKQQEPMPRYHARSVAIMMGHIYSGSEQREAKSEVRVLLGTATPSVESYHNAMKGKYGLVELNSRYKDIELPEIEVVNTRELRRKKMMTGPFSPLLLARVRQALEHGEQAILFQNRRGFAPMMECHQCGWVPRCEHCDVSLTLHRNTGQLTCHYCGFTYRVPTVCPCCGSTELRSRGFGTEKIEDEMMEIFPKARVARMDLDTTRTRNAYERLIGDFAAGRTNILIGTQMISKGLDFDRVSVVGILDADSMMNQPDFRAYEHAFMMMAQVSGRAGRKGRRGLVVLQTKNPDVPLIRQVVHNDYKALYRDLCDERRQFCYPPFCRLIYVFLKHRTESTADTAALELASRLRQWFGTRVLGPDKPVVAKVKNQNIRKIVLKLEPGLNMNDVRRYLRMAQQLLMADKRYASLLLFYDVDPL